MHLVDAYWNGASCAIRPGSAQHKQPSEKRRKKKTKTNSSSMHALLGAAKNKDAKHKLKKERTSVATPLPTVSTVENPSTLGEKEKGLERDRR